MAKERRQIDLPHATRTAGLSTFLWFGFHIALAAFGVIRLTVLAAAVVVLTCAAAVHLDLRRHSMHLFYANLGIAPAQGTAVALLTAIILELGLQAAARILGLP